MLPVFEISRDFGIKIRDFENFFVLLSVTEVYVAVYSSHSMGHSFEECLALP